MTEYTNKSMEEITSEFILRTCQLLQKSNDDVYDRIRFPLLYSKKQLIFCGSSEEFNVRPLNPCIEDMDLLIYKVNELVFIDDIPVLPNDVSGLADIIECLKSEPYLRYPGFVQLRLLGTLNYNWKCKKYEFTRTSSPNLCVKFDLPSEVLNTGWEAGTAVKGPAIMGYCDQENLTIPHDSILCWWCPRWPSEAQNWLHRHRNCKWPTNDIISEVVRHGCHVVYAQHRACRNDEAQCRLSFSVAEVILLQSWTQTQQIVYHLLRFFAKRELIQKDCPKEDEVLCTYHLKTLMLWTCEEMPLEWWNSSSVVAICCKLLQKLSEWLKMRYCPNYFIPEANLFHEPSSSTMLEKTERRLNDFCNSDILGKWFLENYILPFTRKHFKVENTRKLTPHVEDYMHLFLFFRNLVESESLDFVFSLDFTVCDIYSRKIIDLKSCSGLTSCLSYTCRVRNYELLRNVTMSSALQIPENVQYFTYLDSALYSLNAAHSLECGNISWDCERFVEYLKGIFFKAKKVRCHYHVFPKPRTAERIHFQYLQAQNFMENLTVSNSPSEFRLIALLSEDFLRKALECNNTKTNIIVPGALAYLAALHFAKSEDKIVIDLCSAVLMSQTTDLKNESLNAGCLLFIDDIVRIVGFCLLWKKYSENTSFSRKQNYLDLRLSPKLFAHYLAVISAERISKHIELNPDMLISALPLDRYLFIVTKRRSGTSMKSSIFINADRQCIYRRTDSLTDAILCVNPVIVKEKIIDALTEYALENITAFYSVITFRKDLGLQCNTADCYRAWYLYKCRQYDEVLQLCERILHEPYLPSILQDLEFVNVLALPQFDSFFDRDVQSLLGFHKLFCNLTHLNDSMRKFEKENCVRNIFSIKDQVSYFCSYPFFSNKSRYFIERHFLARYLKLRCCIDCNHPYAEAMSEFAAMKINYLFEHIIRWFLLQKLRKNLRV